MSNAAPFAGPASDLIARAREMWEDIVRVFGEPRVLFDQLVMRTRDWVGMANWLRMLEGIVRDAVATIAAGLVLDPPKPRAPMPERDEPAAAVGPDAPRRAPCCFRMMEKRRMPDAARRGDAGSSALHSSQGLALRMEAVARVLAAPLACAKRHARFLARCANATPAQHAGSASALRNPPRIIVFDDPDAARVGSTLVSLAPRRDSS